MKTFLFYLILIFSALQLYGEVVYKDIIPDKKLQAQMGHDALDIDFNNDGINDVTIFHFKVDNFNCGELIVNTKGDSEILCSNSKAIALVKDNNIDGASQEWYKPFPTTTVLYFDAGWKVSQDKYLAVRFKISDKWHYAWVRIELPADESYVLVKDYAWNNAADASIKAGEESAPAPVIELISDSLDFGTVIIGSSSQQLIVINNIGTSDFTVSGISISGMDATSFKFKEKENGFTIKPNETKIFHVLFFPSRIGMATAIVKFINNHDIDAVVYLKAKGDVLKEGILMADILHLYFNDVEIDSAGSKKVQLKNTGAAELQIDSVRITGFNPASFSFSGLILPLKLLPETEAELFLRFCPKSEGPKTAELEIMYDKVKKLVIPMIGSGIVSGISEMSLEPKLIAYPNPAFNTLTIELEELKTTYLTDSYGKLIEKIKPKELIETIDVSKLSAGVYYIRSDNIFIPIIIMK